MAGADPFGIERIEGLHGAGIEFGRDRKLFREAACDLGEGEKLRYLHEADGLTAAVLEDFRSGHSYLL